MAIGGALGNIKFKNKIMNLYKYYSLKTFKLGELVNVFNKVFTTYDCPLGDMKFTLAVKKGEIEGYKEITMDELYSLTELNKNNDYLTCRYNFSSKLDVQFDSISLSTSGKSYFLAIESPRIEVLHAINEIFIKELSLENYIPEQVESTDSKFKKLEERIKLIEENLDKNNIKLTCFISMKFDSKSENYFQILEKFLTLLDINVITGQSYEPRKVSEKVLSKLENNIDFVLYLITGESESFWTRDELVIGSQKGYYSIPLVEKGSKFTGGIFSDLEYIEFEVNSIESAFIKLIEGIKFIANNKKFNIA